MVDVKAQGGARQVGLQNFGAQVKEAAKDAKLSPVEERQLKDAFKTLSPEEKSAAIQLVKASSFPALAAHLTDAPKAQGFGVSKQNGGLMSAKGSDPIPAAAWDNPGPNIVGRLTQNAPPGTKGAVSGNARCAPSNLLAGALMTGPEGAGRMLEEVASRDTSPLSKEDRTRMRDIAGAIKGRTASFDQLSEAQDLLYRAGNTSLQLKEVTDPTRTDKLSKAEQKEYGDLNKLAESGRLTPPTADRLGALLTKANGAKVEVMGTPDDPRVKLTPELLAAGKGGPFVDSELQRLASNGAVLKDSSYPMKDAFDGATIRNLLDTLKPGESAIFRVRATDQQAQPQHFISVGRTKDGTPYIYNPDPAKGDHTLFQGVAGKQQPAEFEKELQRYERHITTDPDGQDVRALVMNNN